MKRVVRWIVVGVLALVVLAGTGFVLWAETPLGPMPEALAALKPDEQVQVNTDAWLTFTPRAAPPTTGMIIYPGARVDPRSYAPAAHAIAAHGFLVVITPMPLNLAVFAPNRAVEVQQAHPEINRWVLAGHSLGGAMAARFAHDSPATVHGLALWAAYPPDDDDLSRTTLLVLLATGSNDGLVDPATLRAAMALLPANTRSLVIAGGNHAQFGWYGDQSGDRAATISRDDQQRQFVDATVQLLQSVHGAGASSTNVARYWSAGV